MKVHVHANEWLESPFVEPPFPFLMQINNKYFNKAQTIFLECACSERFPSSKNHLGPEWEKIHLNFKNTCSTFMSN